MQCKKISITFYSKRFTVDKYGHSRIHGPLETKERTQYIQRTKGEKNTF